jgi:hypothetical protein
MSTVAQPMCTSPAATVLPMSSILSISTSSTWNSPPLESFHFFPGLLPWFAHTIGAQPAHTLTANLTTRSLFSALYDDVPGTVDSVAVGSYSYVSAVRPVTGVVGTFSGVGLPVGFEPVLPPPAPASACAVVVLPSSFRHRKYASAPRPATITSTAMKNAGLGFPAPFAISAFS